MCTDTCIYTIVTAIYLVYNGSHYPGGSYFSSDYVYLNTNPLICHHTHGMRGVGEVLLPNGNTCNDSSRPIQCSHDGDVIVLGRVGSLLNYSTDELTYKCCLPYGCDNNSSLIAIVHIYGK